MNNNEQTSNKKTKSRIEPIAPELGINYASSPLLEYAYPPINETIVKNITNAIIAVPKLYTQVLHLMNKMNLPPPFGPSRKRPEMPKINATIPNSKDEIKYYGDRQINDKDIEEEEEEEEEEYNDKRQKIDTAVSSNPFTKTITTPASISTNEVIPVPPIKVINVEKKEIKDMFIQPIAVRTCISRQDILKHRISKEEMAQQKAFANYSVGNPSHKLYLRNMVKDVTKEDLWNLFGCLFDNDDQVKEQLQIQIMDKRMKGQAFVTFPTEKLAYEAISLVNGYLLRDKPIVVCFGKQQ